MTSTKKPVRIILCDLTYDTLILVSDTMPINIGFIGAYTKQKFGKDISLSLIKYPQSAIEEIKNNPPDIIACSNYSWNSNLSEYILSLAKKANPSVITVQGGTNFPHEDEQQKVRVRRMVRRYVYFLGCISHSSFATLRYLQVLSSARKRHRHGV